MAPLSPFLPEFGSPLGIAAIAFVVIASLYIINSLISPPFPKDVPYIREPPGKRSFSLRTRWAYLTDCQPLFREAYENYSKKGKPVIIPGFGVRKELIMPTSSMRWVQAQPDTVLSVTKAFSDVDQVYYSYGHKRYVEDPWQGMLVKNKMNAVLENIVQAMNDELQVAFDDVFGTDEHNWKELDVLTAVKIVVSQAASRFTVGLPLARNKEYMKDCYDSVDSAIMTAGVAGGTPHVLRPIVGRLVGLKSRLAIRRMRKHFEPTYRERLPTLKFAEDDPQHIEPQDHLQMMLRYAQKERPEELSLDGMARRVMAANFGSMHQTSMQVTNMLLNIIGSDAEFNTIAVLRDEVARVLGDDKVWTKAHIAKMVKSDSVARETLRCQSFGGRALFRKVMVDGVVTDSGLKLPKGCMFSFLGQPAQHDEDIHDEPLKYDPFRFSRVRETVADSSKAPALSFVTTSPDHLPFGHGRHACPGRFLVDFELKMIISYVLMNYDLKFPDEYNGKRPANRWMAEANVPPAGAKMLVKRRKAT
ncbi:putative cytochrome p450 protein [Phaeoacremonium minimum UCRPA7]|uniref:Putative cytochrome p450 protein n=1 Tax=Phaeoacremonium minimum (strain UCR-PA7) TaxID=1286976 RepID=R8BN76_PHAM7|nr:putative cytochrome p450 protein [Phaeoacremonium minimum UCRPA7]EOO00787.1 putative cytochrome p450 protein [Phaeoacremonium minimum UCRPA7]